MTRLHRLALASLVALGLAAAVPCLRAAPGTFGELVDLVVDAAASRSLDWSSIEVAGGGGDSASVTVKGRARLHQFAGILALARGPAELGKDEGLRTCSLEVQLDPRPSPGGTAPAVAAILADLASRAGSDATLILAPRTEGVTDLSFEASLPATPAATPCPSLAGLGSWGSVASMKLTRRPDGALAVQVRTRLPLPSPVAGAPASPPPPEWILSPTDGGTAIRLAVPALSREDGGATAADVLTRFGERLRLMSVTLRPDAAALHASLAPDSGTVQGR